jgi:hypothetical protein
MANILHHLAALGWGRVALFFALALVAIACAAVAVSGRRRGRALWALLLSGGVALVSVAATTAVAVAGIGSTANPSADARQLAGGISVAMNGTALGLLTTLVAGVASAVCLVAALLHRPSSRAPVASSRPGVP